MGQSVKKSVNIESLMFKVNNEYELQDTTGNRNTSYIQEGFGNVLAQSGSADNKYHLTTKEIDLDTRLYYFYARWYDAGLGRFVSKDPIWHVNLYIYVYNNPINKIDPRGLQSFNASGIGIDLLCAVLPELPGNVGPVFDFICQALDLWEGSDSNFICDCIAQSRAAQNEILGFCENLCLCLTKGDRIRLAICLNACNRYR